MSLDLVKLAERERAEGFCKLGEISYVQNFTLGKWGCDEMGNEI